MVGGVVGEGLTTTDGHHSPPTWTRDTQVGRDPLTSNTAYSLKVFNLRHPLLD